MSCYVIEEDGERTSYPVHPIGTRVKVTEHHTGGQGKVCRIEEYVELWEGGPVWPVISHPSFPMWVSISPASIRPTDFVPREELEQLPLFGGMS